MLPCMIPDIIEAGCDEAGRGCLAGPVCAAAVILLPGFECEGLNDSKQLSAKRREALCEYIEKNALAWAVVMVEADEIDRINILQASITAMHRAIDKLEVRPEHLIVDGNKFRPYGDVPYHTVVKGDATYSSIAAASILAKTHRDELMKKLDSEYPQYGWKKNAGYPTKEHRKAIIEHGLSPYHRRTFGPCRDLLTSLF